MGYTIEQIQKAIQSEFFLREGEASWIEHLLTDSRRIVYRQDDGENYLVDGRKFLGQLFQSLSSPRCQNQRPFSV